MNSEYHWHLSSVTFYELNLSKDRQISSLFLEQKAIVSKSVWLTCQKHSFTQWIFVAMYHTVIQTRGWCTNELSWTRVVGCRNKHGCFGLDRELDHICNTDAMMITLPTTFETQNFLWWLFNTLRPDKMDTIFQTTFSNGFSWMKMYEFR